MPRNTNKQISQKNGLTFKRQRAYPSDKLSRWVVAFLKENEMDELVPEQKQWIPPSKGAIYYSKVKSGAIEYKKQKRRYKK